MKVSEIKTPVSSIAGIGPQLTKTLAKVNVFTFLRDPVQRLISEYIFYKTWKNNHLFKIINDNKISFTDYLLSKDRILIYRGKNFMTRCISGRAFISTKHPYTALAIAKRQIEKNFFFFGILERFTESILLLSKILNLQNIFFLHHNKLNNNLKECITDEEKSKVEQLVNKWISEGLEVRCEEMTKEEAINSGAECMFIEKYPNIVTVYSIGDVSKELCGGPHVKNTAELDEFEIIKEEASSAGVRRIKGILKKKKILNKSDMIENVTKYSATPTMKR